MPPRVTIAKGGNHQYLPACRRTKDAALGNFGNHPKPKFSKKQNFDPLKFLFFQRITFSQLRVLFSPRRGVVKAIPPFGGTMAALSAFHESHLEMGAQHLPRVPLLEVAALGALTRQPSSRGGRRSLTF